MADDRIEYAIGKRNERAARGEIWTRNDANRYLLEAEERLRRAKIYATLAIIASVVVWGVGIVTFFGGGE